MLQFLNQEEGKTLEFKRGIDSLSPILKTVVAFANTSGGQIVIGIDDKTRDIVGVEDVHLMEERLSTSISDSVFPQVLPNIEIWSNKNKSCVVIEIFPGSVRPYYIKSQGEISGTYVRVGSTNRLVDSFMLESLRRTRFPTTFDEEVVLNSSIDDLDMELITNSFLPERKVNKNHLLTLGVISSQEGKKKPTYGGLILLSQNKEHYLPDAWIQVGCFRGSNKTHIIDSQKIGCPFITAVDEVMAFIRKHLNVAIVIDDVRHREEWSIPQIAIREAVLNSIMHCDYSLGGSPIRIALFDDRLEIENPGLLPFGVTFEHLHKGVSKIRNRVLARVLSELKMVERWGSGINRIKEVCHQAGLKEPLFEEVGCHFRVTLFKEVTHLNVLTVQEENIKSILSKNRGLSTKEIAEIVGVSSRQVRKFLIQLLSKGVILEVKRNDYDPDKKYFLR